MKPIAISLLLAAGFGFALPAAAGVYKCVDPQGRITYTNDQNAAKRCKQLDTDLPVTTVPAPLIRRPAQATANPTPATFPKVTPEAQRGRDAGRRQILEQELQTEQAALGAARAQLESNTDSNAAGSLADKVALHQRNIEAIQREIGNLR